MEDHKKHNNYTNYPTWLLATTIANNKKLYNFFKNLSTADLSIIYATIEELLGTDIKAMKDFHESLLNYAFSQINIAEIAREIKEDN